MTWKNYRDDYLHCPAPGELVMVRFESGRKELMIAWRDGDDHMHFSRAEDYADTVMQFTIVNPERDAELDQKIALREATK